MRPPSPPRKASRAARAPTACARVGAMGRDDMDQIVCPDPATFIGWQNAMTQAGIGLLVALGLFAVIAWAARPVGWRLRAACGVCAALALGASASSFVMRAWLDKAGVYITPWFPFYPLGCDPPYVTVHAIPNPPASLTQQALRVVVPVEHWATVDLTVAMAVGALMALLVVILARAARQREHAIRMTSVIAD